MSFMLLCSERKYQDIVHIQKNKIKVFQGFKNVSLEELRSVAKTEKHTNLLKNSKESSDSHLYNIDWGYRYLIICLVQFKLVKKIYTLQAHQIIQKIWNRKFIKKSLSVQPTIVTTNTPRTVLFYTKQMGLA